MAGTRGYKLDTAMTVDAKYASKTDWRVGRDDTWTSTGNPLQQLKPSTSREGNTS